MKLVENCTKWHVGRLFISLVAPAVLSAVLESAIEAQMQVLDWLTSDMNVRDIMSYSDAKIVWQVSTVPQRVLSTLVYL